MSKDDKKDKDVKPDTKDNSSQGPSEEAWPAAQAKLAGNYSDGHPLDCVQYLEAKLILKPDRFISVDSFRDFGKLVQRTAKKLEGRLHHRSQGWPPA